MKVGLTENKDDDSEDTPCDERKKTSFQHLKEGSKFQEGGYDSCNQCDEQVKILTSLKAHEDVVHVGVRYSGDQCNYQLKDKKEMDSTGNLAMKLSDTHVNCVNKKRKKSLIPSSTIQRPMKIKGISVISAIKKSHHNKDFKSMKVQSIHVMSALK